MGKRKYADRYTIVKRKNEFCAFEGTEIKGKVKGWGDNPVSAIGRALEWNRDVEVGLRYIYIVMYVGGDRNKVDVIKTHKINNPCYDQLTRDRIKLKEKMQNLHSADPKHTYAMIEVIFSTGETKQMCVWEKKEMCE